MQLPSNLQFADTGEWIIVLGRAAEELEAAQRELQQNERW